MSIIEAKAPVRPSTKQKADKPKSNKVLILTETVTNELKVQETLTI